MDELVEELFYKLDMYTYVNYMYNDVEFDKPPIIKLLKELYTQGYEDGLLSKEN